MNKPYVKQYNEQGLVNNLIVGSYKSTEPNRRKRRELESRTKNKPFIGNKKGISLVVVQVGALSFQKYKNFIQVVKMNDGSIKRINQSQLVK